MGLSSPHLPEANTFLRFNSTNLLPILDRLEAGVVEDDSRLRLVVKGLLAAGIVAPPLILEAMPASAMTPAVYQASHEVQPSFSPVPNETPEVVAPQPAFRPPAAPPALLSVSAAHTEAKTFQPVEPIAGPIRVPAPITVAPTVTEAISIPKVADLPTSIDLSPPLVPLETTLPAVLESPEAIAASDMRYTTPLRAQLVSPPPVADTVSLERAKPIVKVQSTFVPVHPPTSPTASQEGTNTPAQPRLAVPPAAITELPPKPKADQPVLAGADHLPAPPKSTAKTFKPVLPRLTAPPAASASVVPPSAEAPAASPPQKEATTAEKKAAAVKTALDLAWSSGNHGKTPKDEYKAAVQQFNGSDDEDVYTDCGVYDATVYRMSGADPQFFLRGTANQTTYLNTTGAVWTHIGPAEHTADLQPGDDIIYDKTTSPKNPIGHTFIFTGSLPNGDNAAAASWHGHAPETFQVTDKYLQSEPFQIYRLTDAPIPAPTPPEASTPPVTPAPSNKTPSFKAVVVPPPTPSSPEQPAPEVPTTNTAPVPPSNQFKAVTPPPNPQPPAPETAPTTPAPTAPSPAPAPKPPEAAPAPPSTETQHTDLEHQFAPNDEIKNKLQDQKEVIMPNVSVYQQAADAVGVRWEALAALDYREAGNDMNRSAIAGEDFGTVNPDTHEVMPTNKLDSLKAQANILVEKARQLSITLTKDSTVEDYARAFLRYNRGNMYDAANTNYTDSPYVMNGIDADHTWMHWPNSSAEPKSTRGKVNKQLGAVPLYMYLRQTVTPPAPEAHSTPVASAGADQPDTAKQSKDKGDDKTKEASKPKAGTQKDFSPVNVGSTGVDSPTDPAVKTPTVNPPKKGDFTPVKPKDIKADSSTQSDTGASSVDLLATSQN